MRTQDQPNGSGNLHPTTSECDSGSSSPRRDLESFARRAVVGVLLAVAGLALAYLAWRGAHVLLQAFAGVLFAVFLSALAGWLHRHTRLSYGLALTVVVLALLLATGGVGWLIANQLALQVQELMHRVPQSLGQVRDALQEHPWGRVLLEYQTRAGDPLPHLGQFFNLSGLLSGITGFGVAILVILFVGIFGAAEPDVYREGVLHLVPPARRRRAREALDALNFNLRWWLVGQAVLMVVMWITTTVGLWLIGVPFALTLGLLAGVLELVPYLGPWISVVPAVLIAFTVSPTTVLLTLALYLALHILEGYFLVPLIQRQAVHLPPALTLVAQVLLGELLGVLGLLVAAPLTLCAVVLMKMLYVEDTLGDQAIDVPGEPGNERKQAVTPA
jgi:predicted PurR-regulated permease PerM